MLHGSTTESYNLGLCSCSTLDVGARLFGLRPTTLLSKMFIDSNLLELTHINMCDLRMESLPYAQCDLDSTFSTLPLPYAVSVSTDFASITWLNNFL
jgi:hypothetical protein